MDAKPHIIEQCKWQGKCRSCSGVIAAGSRIYWSKAVGQRGRMWHVECAPRHDGEPHTPPPIIPQVEPDATPQGVAGDDMPNLIQPLTPDEMTPDMPGGVGDAPAKPWLKDMARDLLPELEALGISARKDGAPAPPVEVVNVIVVQRDNGERIKVDMPHRMFGTMCKMLCAADSSRNVYLHGAPGAGKSFSGSALAAALDVSYRYTSLCPLSMPSIIVGYMDANGRYISTPFRDCWEHGGVYGIDEVDNANAMTLTMLNNALSLGICEFPDGAQVKRHPKCYIISTGNTCGNGPTAAFPERRALDNAFRTRFMFLAWDYDKAHERKIAKSIGTDEALSDAWCKWVHDVRDYTADAFKALTCSPRAIYAGIALLTSLPVPLVAEAVLFQGTEAGVVARIVEAVPYPEVVLK